MIGKLKGPHQKLVVEKVLFKLLSRKDSSLKEAMETSNIMWDSVF